jgi:hypothetical protein
MARLEAEITIARPAGAVFDSWIAEPLATNLGGELAIILLPDLVSAAIAASPRLERPGKEDRW